MENVISASAQSQDAGSRITMHDVGSVLGKTGFMAFLLAEVAVAAFLLSVALNFAGDVPARLALLASGQTSVTLCDLMATPLLFAPLMIYAAAAQAVRYITGAKAPGSKVVLYISRALATAIVGGSTLSLVFTLANQEDGIPFAVAAVASLVITLIAYFMLSSKAHCTGWLKKLVSPTENPLLAILVLSLAVYVQFALSAMTALILFAVVTLFVIALAIALIPTYSYRYRRDWWW